LKKIKACINIKTQVSNVFKLQYSFLQQESIPEEINDFQFDFFLSFLILDDERFYLVTLWYD